MARTKQTARRAAVDQNAQMIAAMTKKTLSLASKEKARAKKMKVILKKQKKDLGVLKKKLSSQKKAKAKAKKVYKTGKKSLKESAKVRAGKRKAISCQKSASELVSEFKELNPTLYEVQKMNKERYQKLRAKVSATLNKIRKYTYRCE